VILCGGEKAHAASGVCIQYYEFKEQW